MGLHHPPPWGRGSESSDLKESMNEVTKLSDEEVKKIGDDIKNKLDEIRKGKK